MSFDPLSLTLSLLMSVIGYAVFRYGRRMERIPHVVFGIALMGYSYFTPTPAWTLLVGAGLIGSLWLVTRRGY